MTDQEYQTYIEKKNNLLSSIESLVGFWDMAPSIISLIKSQYITEEIVDSLIDILSNSIKNVKDKDAQEKISVSINIIQQMKRKELEEKQEQQARADKEILDLQYI